MAVVGPTETSAQRWVMSSIEGQPEAPLRCNECELLTRSGPRCGRIVRGNALFNDCFPFLPGDRTSSGSRQEDAQRDGVGSVFGIFVVHHARPHPVVPGRVKFCLVRKRKERSPLGRTNPNLFGFELNTV
jgi:hypothetical protein